MKKYILTLLSLLVLGASYTTAQADDLTYASSLEDGKYYYVVSGFTGFGNAQAKANPQAIYYDSNNATYPYWKTLDDTNINFVFKLIKANDDNGWYLQNVSNSQYFGSSDGSIKFASENDRVVHTIAPVDDKTGYFTIVNTAASTHHVYPGSYGNGSTGTIETGVWGDWSTNGEANYWHFCPITELMQKEVDALTSSDYVSELTDGGYYYIVNGKTDFVDKETKAMCYSSTNAKYPYWATLDESDAKYVFKLTQAETDGQWYIQNVYNEKYFGEVSKTSDGDDDNDLTKYTTEQSTPFVITALGSNYFSIKRPSDTSYLYPGGYGAKTTDFLSSNGWGTDGSTPNDAGKWQFKSVSEATITNIQTTKATTKTNLLNQLNNYNGTDNLVFGMTADNLNSATAIVNAGSLETFDNFSIDDYINPLTTGYYRIANARTKASGAITSVNNARYLTVGADKKMSVITKDEAQKDLGSIYKITVDGSTHYIETQDLYLEAGNGIVYAATKGSQHAEVLPFAGVSNPTASVRVSENNGYFGYNYFLFVTSEDEVKWYSTIAGKEATLQHYIIPATDFTITTNAVGSETYATLYAPFPVSLPDGLTAYTGELKTDNGNNLLLLTKVDGTIPAATPVILIGNDANKTSYTLGIVNEDVEGLNQPNSLTGQYLADTAAGSTDLTLGLSNSGNVGFYKYSGTISANKARLTGFSGSKGFTFTFGDDDPTGINTATVSGATLTVGDVIYDLQGRRVQDAKHGIYIINGKKTVVK